MRKFTVEIIREDTNYHPENKNEVVSYDITFQLVDENGVTYQTPTTVYAYQIAPNDLGTAIERATVNALVPTIGRMYGKYTEKPADWFDTIVPNLDEDDKS
jgi:hypothetical protein